MVCMSLKAASGMLFIDIEIGIVDGIKRTNPASIVRSIVVSTLCTNCCKNKS